MIRIKSYNIPQSILGNKKKSLNHRLCLDWSCSTIHTVVTWHSKTFVNDLLSKILKKSIRVENDKTSPGNFSKFSAVVIVHKYEVATANIARFLLSVCYYYVTYSRLKSSVNCKIPKFWIQILIPIFAQRWDLNPGPVLIFSALLGHNLFYRFWDHKNWSVQTLIKNKKIWSLGL